MKAFSALYCTETNSLLEFYGDGVVVRSPRKPCEEEYWLYDFGWIRLSFGETIYEEIDESEVPALVVMAKALAQ